VRLVGVLLMGWWVVVLVLRLVRALITLVVIRLCHERSVATLVGLGLFEELRLPLFGCTSDWVPVCSQTSCCVGIGIFETELVKVPGFGIARFRNVGPENRDVRD
jgi:hypothetical protein